MILRKLVKKILLYLNILAAASLLISYSAAFINPKYLALPSFFGLAYPYILLLNIIFFIFWLIKMKREAAISLVVILIGFTHLHNYINFHNKGSSDYDFKLMSYNLRLFNRYEGSIRTDKNVIEFINREAPDIICLQEFYNDGSMIATRRKLSTMFNKRYEVHLKPIRSTSRMFYGIVTLSAYPVVNRGDIVHPNSSSLTIFTDVVINNDTMRVYNNHLQSFRLRRIESTFLEEIYGGDEKEMVKEVRKLSASLKRGFIQRAMQAKSVSWSVGQSPYPVIVCGDFNDTPVSYTYRKIRKNMSDAFVEAGNGTGFTYRDKYPPNRIDYILYSDKISCSRFVIEKVRYSDHYPVTAYFKLNY